MLNIISSPAETPNEESFRPEPRVGTENNLKWLARNWPASGKQTKLIMVGGTGQISFRLRVAQSHIRHDLTPSSWSHIMLVDEEKTALEKTTIKEISLNPVNGFGFPPMTNGVKEVTLNEYRNRSRFPNIAILGIPVDLDAVRATLERFKKQRAALDSVDLILRWLGFCWGVAHSPNPLMDGMGIPSAALLDVVLGAVGFDLTPGLESRSSCPEAVWQAARWWRSYYTDQNQTEITGAYCVSHKLMNF
ncbi:MAG: hypothetical protein ABIP75_11230 [Pyrinomonadaceae bacterium]